MSYVFRNLRTFFLDRRQILLVDFFGAMATSLATIFLLASGRIPTGLPTVLLYSMALIAFGFACFDAVAYFLFVDIGIALATIACLNVGYCTAVLAVLFLYSHEISVLGLLYFCVEVAIVIPLSGWEWTAAKRLNG